MSTHRENDESFFVELENAAKLLSVADGRITSADLRALFAELKGSREERDRIEMDASPRQERGS